LAFKVVASNFQPCSRAERMMSSEPAQQAPGSSAAAQRLLPPPRDGGNELADSWADWFSEVNSWSWPWCGVFSIPFMTFAQAALCLITKTQVPHREDQVECIVTMMTAAMVMLTLKFTNTTGYSGLTKLMFRGLAPVENTQEPVRPGDLTPVENTQEPWRPGDLTPVGNTQAPWRPGDLLQAIKEFEPFFQRSKRFADLFDKVIRRWDRCPKECFKQTWKLLDILMLFYGPYLAFRVFHYPQVPFSEQPKCLSWTIASQFFGGVAYVCLLRKVFTALLVPLLLSRLAVLRIIHELGHPREDFPWDEMTFRVRLLDKELEKLWSIRNAGGPWICALLMAVAQAARGVLLLFNTTGRMAEAMILFFLASFVALLFLFFLSSIASLCMSQNATGASIPSAAQSYGAYLVEGDASLALIRECDSELFEQECKREKAWQELRGGRVHSAAQTRFMSYVNQNTMGVEIFGVLVTQKLVLQLAVKVLAEIPVVTSAFTCAFNYWHKQSIQTTTTTTPSS